MGSQPETPTLPLFSIPPMQSPEHPGMLTPPLHAAVSVPFRWEEQPGKPRPCTDLIAFTAAPDHAMFSGRPKCLDPPPRLYLEYSSSCRNTVKSPSPTTVLDGPYITARPQFSSSFRFFSDGGSPEKGQLRTLVLGEEKKKKKRSWWQRTLKFKGGGGEIGGSSFIFPSSYNSMDAASDDNGNNSSVKMARFTRNGSFSSLSPARSHFWATIYHGVKQVMPWKCKKSKKEDFAL